MIRDDLTFWYQHTQIIGLFISLYFYARTTRPISTRFDGKVVRWPQKNPLDFGGNPDHVKLDYD